MSSQVDNTHCTVAQLTLKNEGKYADASGFRYRAICSKYCPEINLDIDSQTEVRVWY